MITDDHPSIPEQQQQSNQQFPMPQSQVKGESSLICVRNEKFHYFLPRQAPLTPQMGHNQMPGVPGNQLQQSPAMNSGGTSHPNANPGNNTQPNPQQLHQNQTAQQQQQHQNLNVIYLCRYGQETVQDIVSRFQEVFQTLKSVQPPIGAPNNNSKLFFISNQLHICNTNLQQLNLLDLAPTPNDKKVTEQFRTIRLLFRRLRLIFERCNDTRQLGNVQPDLRTLFLN